MPAGSFVEDARYEELVLPLKARRFDHARVRHAQAWRCGQ